MSQNQNKEKFRSHSAAESAFAAAELSRLAGLSSSLAAEARRLLVPVVDRGSGPSSSPFEDSEPERIGDWLYFTRTSGEAGSCALLRRKVSGNEKGEEELVVDVAEVASSQEASSLGQLKLSPCGRAVAMTLDVGGGREAWRAVVVEEEEKIKILFWALSTASQASSGEGEKRFPSFSCPVFFFPELSPFSASALLHEGRREGGGKASDAALRSLGRVGAKVPLRTRKKKAPLLLSSPNPTLPASSLWGGPRTARCSLWRLLRWGGPRRTRWGCRGRRSGSFLSPPSPSRFGFGFLDFDLLLPPSLSRPDLRGALRGRESSTT